MMNQAEKTRSQWNQQQLALFFLMVILVVTVNDLFLWRITTTSHHQASDESSSRNDEQRSFSPPNDGASSVATSSSDDVTWKWYHYSHDKQQHDNGNNDTTTTTEQEPEPQQQEHGHRRLLIAQYYTPGVYESLLTETSRINRAYARLHGFDYVLVQGIGFQLASDDIQQQQQRPKESRATFNKLYILLSTYIMQQYDLLLLLDADAMVYNFTVDVRDYMPDDKALVAHRVRTLGEPDTCNINIGVTLWNLRHDQLYWLADQWRLAAMARIERIAQDQALLDSDQQPFQAMCNTIPSDQRLQLIHSLYDEFGSRINQTTGIPNKGRVIKHFMRGGNGEWWPDNNSNSNHENNTTDKMDKRLTQIQETAREICHDLYPTACQGLYPTAVAASKDGAGFWTRLFGGQR